MEVVICLKTRTFAVSQTTGTAIPLPNMGCDLLENSYFCSIANNEDGLEKELEQVVICLKTRTFAVSQTTKSRPVGRHSCCDLLENSYFCSIANNTQRIAALDEQVVICLKTRTFAVSQTTVLAYRLRLLQL